MHTVFDNVDYGAALFILFLVWGFRVVVFFLEQKVFIQSVNDAR